MPRPIRTILSAIATLAAVSATPALAQAQNVIPGDLNAGKVVSTSLPGVTVGVSQPSTSTVTVTVTNASGRALTCAGPYGNGNIGATVSSARVALAAVHYYGEFAHKPDPVTLFGSSGRANNANGEINLQVPFGPLLGLLPSGSIAPILGDAYAARDWISRQHTAATMAGHTGTTGTFSVANNGSQERTISLTPPSNGPRTDFDAGAFLVCTDSNNQAYALAGYESGSAPVPRGGVLPIGSTGNR